MVNGDTTLWWLILAGSAVMFVAMCRGIGSSSVAVAQNLIDKRRELEAREREANAAAEADGQAAALEPLALNSDGSVEEPIIGVVESR
jgi:hypothetical protein